MQSAKVSQKLDTLQAIGISASPVLLSSVAASNPPSESEIPLVLAITVLKQEPPLTWLRA